MAISKRTGILGGAAAAMVAGVTAVMMLVSSGIVNTRTGTDYGSDLQRAVNEAVAGDVITVPANTPISVNLTLAKSNPVDVIIQSSRAAELPEGKRVGPAQSELFAKLQSATNAEPVIKTVAGARGYRFIGVEISTATPDIFVYDLVRWGGGRDTQKTVASVPSGLGIDRSYIHGWPTQDSQAGVTMNCADCWVTNSYISEIHTVGIEAQAIRGWNGTNGAHIVNNYLEAAGENVMIGGADSATAELIPANIEILRNHLFKPLSWKVGHPTYAGKHWTVKNLLEMKDVINAVIVGNVLENNWTDAQDGKPVLFTTRNQECSAPWSTVRLVIFTDNTVKNAEGGMNFQGVDNEAKPGGKCPVGSPLNPDGSGSVRGTDALVSNNLFDNINGPWLVVNGFSNLSISRNTHTQNGNLITFYGGDISTGFSYTDNLTIDHDYGIRDENGIEGIAALEKWTPAYRFTGNAIAKPYTNYPAGNGNIYPASLTLPDDFRSPYPGIGADVDRLAAAQSGVVGPTPTPTSTPTPSPTATATATSTPSPTATLPPASPSPAVKPSPSPSPSPPPSPTPLPCLATSWPSSVAGQNSQMSSRRAQGCYPVRRTNGGMEYVRP